MKQKCKLFKLQNKKHGWLAGASISVIHQFLFTMMSDNIFQFAKESADFYGTQKEVIKAAYVIENGFIVATISVLNVLIRRASIHRCLLLGAYLTIIPNIVTFFIPNVYAFYICRMIHGIGYGMSLPTGVAITNYLVVDSQVPAGLCVINALAPCGATLSFYLNPLILQATKVLSPHLFNVILTIMQIAYLITLHCILPTPFAIDKTVTVNAAALIFSLAIQLLFASSVAVVVYIKNLSLVLVGVLVCLVLLAIVMLPLFLYINRKLTKKVIPTEVLNHNSVMFLVQFFFMFVIQNLLIATENEEDQFKQFNIYRTSKYGQQTLNIMVHLRILMPVAFIYPIHVMLKRITIQKTSISLSSIILLLLLVNMFNNAFMKSAIVLCVSNIIMNITIVANQTTMQYYNLSHAGKRFAPVCGSFLYFGSRIAVTVSYFLQWCADQLYQYIITQNQSVLQLNAQPETKSLIIYIVCGVFAFICVVITNLLGVFEFERGKIGFREYLLNRTVSYDDLRVDQINKEIQTENIDNKFEDFNNFEDGQTVNIQTATCTNESADAGADAVGIVAAGSV